MLTQKENIKLLRSIENKLGWLIVIATLIFMQLAWFIPW